MGEGKKARAVYVPRFDGLDPDRSFSCGDGEANLFSGETGAAGTRPGTDPEGYETPEVLEDQDALDYLREMENVSPRDFLLLGDEIDLSLDEWIMMEDIEDDEWCHFYGIHIVGAKDLNPRRRDE